jgi:hypothetical protein
VGPMTITMLLRNTLEAARRQHAHEHGGAGRNGLATVDRARAGA